MCVLALCLQILAACLRVLVCCLHVHVRGNPYSLNEHIDLLHRHMDVLMHILIHIMVRLNNLLLWSKAIKTMMDRISHPSLAVSQGVAQRGCSNSVSFLIQFENLTDMTMATILKSIIFLRKIPGNTYSSRKA